jgi:SEC-C motif-containing protein
MRIAQNQPCPCTSGRRYKQCCGPSHDHEAGTPEALMRSRYAAYALGKTGYIIRTTHPDSPHRQPDARAWQADLAAWCATTEFVRLEIIATEESGDIGHVWFRAHLHQRERDGILEERSRFIRVDGTWRYVADDPHWRPAP